MADLAAREAEWRGYVRRSAWAFSAANILGGIIVFVFMALVLPTPDEVADDWDALYLNLAVFLPGVVAVAALANWLGHRRVAPVAEWFLSGREPDAAAREVTLRQPWLQMGVSVITWGLGA